MFVAKESNENMITISIYSGLVVYEVQKEKYLMSKEKLRTFQCVEPFSYNYTYIGDVDNQNTLCHGVETK